jgi:hypothetical protein
MSASEPGYNIKHYRRILMRGPIRKTLVAALAVCAYAALPVGSASAATIEKTVGVTKTPFQAIYGNPPAGTPVGGGLGRNFGFGENMLFQAGNGVGVKLAMELDNGTQWRARDSFIGGTLMSNKTPENDPLSFSIQFVDLQLSILRVGTTEIEIPWYADTSDRPWIAEICSVEATANCTPDVRVAAGNTGLVKIENVSFNLGGGATPTVVQGTVWGNWANGALEKAPCITLKKPPAAVEADKLFVTQATAGVSVVGEQLKEISGKACLISANNDWYRVGLIEGEALKAEEPAIVIKK